MKHGYKNEFGQYKPVLVKKLQQGAHIRTKTPMPSNRFNEDSEKYIETIYPVPDKDQQSTRRISGNQLTFMRDIKSFGLRQEKPFTVSTSKKAKYQSIGYPEDDPVNARNRNPNFREKLSHLKNAALYFPDSRMSGLKTFGGTGIQS